MPPADPGISRLESGEIAVGDEITVLPSGRTSKVKEITTVHHETALLNMNDIARVAMKVQQPLALDHYSKNRFTVSFIVIDEATNNTVMAGCPTTSISFSITSMPANANMARPPG